MIDQALPSVRIVLPAYNEAQTLTATVSRLHAFCRRSLCAYRWHILVVANGCSDDTAKIAQHLTTKYDQLQMADLKTAGRGGALRHAAQLPGGDYLLYMDVDLSTELSAVPKLLAALDRGADLAVGSRHHPRSRVVRRWNREVLSRGYNLVLRNLLAVKTFGDAQCGFKAFRLARLRPLLAWVRDHHWFFDTEVLVLAEYSGLKLVELPVQWTEDLDSRVELPTTIARKIMGLARLKFTARRLVTSNAVFK